MKFKKSHKSQYHWKLQLVKRKTLTWGDFIEDQDAIAPDDAASYILLQEQIEDVFTCLTDREQQVLILRFGLKDGKPRTLEEVGQHFNVTRERIRQIEGKALTKLRNRGKRDKIKDFL